MARSVSLVREHPFLPLGNWCLANWATTVCQQEELSTHCISLYISYSPPPSVFCEHPKSSWALLEWYVYIGLSILFLPFRSTELCTVVEPPLMNWI